MIKLLLFSDLHCDVAAARRLVELSHSVDVVVGAGDFAQAHRGLEETVSLLTSISKPVVLVAGNNETTEELRQACRNWPSVSILHGTGVTVGGIEFFGLGGGVPVTPFGSWSYDFSEAEAELLLQACPANGVLVSHSPPQGLVDIASNGRSLGSTAVRTIIEQRQPRLVVCGHIHHSAGQSQTLGATTVINAGPQGIKWNW